jgi:hypothetical protein
MASEQLEILFSEGEVSRERLRIRKFVFCVRSHLSTCSEPRYAQSSSLYDFMRTTRS